MIKQNSEQRICCLELQIQRGPCFGSLFCSQLVQYPATKATQAWCPGQIQATNDDNQMVCKTLTSFWAADVVKALTSKNFLVLWSGRQFQTTLHAVFMVSVLWRLNLKTLGLNK